MRFSVVLEGVAVWPKHHDTVVIALRIGNHGRFRVGTNDRKTLIPSDIGHFLENPFIEDAICKRMGGLRIGRVIARKVKFGETQEMGAEQLGTLGNAP